jgi:hypothetical protein
MARNRTVKAKYSPIAAEDDWRAQSDLDTYTRWCEIKKDKKRLANMQELAKKKMTEMAAAASMGGSDNDGDE